MLPTTDFFGTPITRLILGDNPINGHSYIPDITPGGEMMDYYTSMRMEEPMSIKRRRTGWITLMSLPGMMMALDALSGRTS